MKKTLFLVLLLCLALFGDPRPGGAVSLGTVSADLLDRLEKEGWTEVSSGVMQRTWEGGKVETLGFGAEGLRFKLEEMKGYLAFLRKEYARHPSPDLRRAIRGHRAETLRVRAAVNKTDAAGALESANEAIVAWGTDCLANYDASVYAFPLDGGSGANAEAYFNNDCGYTGEVYATSYATATTADGTMYIAAKNDPSTAPGTPRFGGDVSAGSSVSINGVTDCFSSATASVTNYDFGITYLVSARNGDSGRKDGRCSGSPDVQPFAADAASNLRLPASTPVHPDSSAMVANLNSSQHQVHLSHYGRAIYNAAAGTPRTIVCTRTWGTCDLSLQPVPINASWKPASGSEGSMTVVDYVNRKIYDFYQVAKNPDGTVMINADGTVSTGYGAVTELDGSGHGRSVSGSNLSYLFGTIRVYEMERATSDPANAIQHALAFTSSYACDTYRYPATKSNGTSTATACIPVGSRIFLDATADCSAISTVGERAVCHALQKYGAYLIGTRGQVFGLKFEKPTAGDPGGANSDPYPGAGLADLQDMVNIPWSKLKVANDCQCSTSNLTLTGGRPFAERAASNVPLPSSPSQDANSAAMVANLNSGKHQVNLYGNGKAVFDASAGTPRTIVCTEPWGTCDLSRQPVPVNASWKPSSGSHPALSVIDYTNRKVYDFYRVATNPDGTVMINIDGTVSTGWGRISDLDGNGQASGSSLSDLFGLVRVFEMERAATDPANAIPHALAVKTQYACSTWRYPAPQSNGSFTGTGCIPVGSRLFLDSAADCSTVSQAGEKAVCHALRKYGAYVIGTAGSAFNIVFEVPSGGQPGGSAPDPYPSVGLAWDYYDLSQIPWSRLKVAKDCQCTPY